MAGRIRRILVAIRDLDHPHSVLLRKVAALSRPAGAAVELFHAVDGLRATSRPSPVDGETLRRLRQAAMQHALRRLGRLARARALSDLSVVCQVAADAPAHEAIVRRAVSTHADLVVAGSHAPGGIGRWMLRNTDWELIRQCPCPLLLIKSRRAYRQPTVMVAVDPFHAHAKPADLDRRLLRHGVDMARMLGGAVHAAHCYMPLVNITPLPSAPAIPMVVPPELEASHHGLVARIFDRLTRSAGISESAKHLEVGIVSNELTALAKRLRADIVVMGAVSRSGLRR